MSDDIIYHLLVPGKYRVWCRRKAPSPQMNITRFPSKASCADCLSAYRYAKGGNEFRVEWTNRRGARSDEADLRGEEE